jgi:ectoine hydroxylase-related dioxygenase (phytanoyl-CoA dioxygenase family)
MGLDRPDRCQHLVVMIYLSGATAESGATAVVPGSHLLEENPPGAMLGLQLDGSVPGEVDPGGALLFDGRTWHTALPNHSDRDRETITIR